MKDVYGTADWDQLPLQPQQYGVIGWPVHHSLSPLFQGPAFRHLGLPASYIRLAIPPEEFDDSIRHMKALPFAGWNCTLPHKIALLAHMDELASSARLLGGVNTVVRGGDGRWIGHNTDGEGWMRAVQEAFSIDLGSLRIFILGAGGAGQALARQASSRKCRSLRLANRSLDKAQAIAAGMPGNGTSLELVPWDPSVLREVLRDCDLVVNTTSLGLKAEDPPILDRDCLHPGLMVYDTIYKPAETGLLREAKAAGARTSNGLGMLLHQGALSFEIWTRQTPPLAVMRQALETAASAL